MKHSIIPFIITIFLILSCGVSKKNTTTENPTSMMILLDTTFTKFQFDSLCVADTINPNYKEWLVMSFIDYETNKTINEYTYIKTLNEDEIMYRLIIDETEYNIIKRLTDN